MSEQKVSVPQEVLDDFALDRVPLNRRRNVWEVTLVRLGQLSCMPLFMGGAALGYGMSFWPAVLALFLGVVILEFFGALMGIVGANEGLPTALVTRWAGFGKYGSSILSLLLAVGIFGWFAIQNGLFAEALNGATGGALGPVWSTILSGAFITAIVIVGFTSLRWTANIAVPAFLVLCFISLAKTQALSGNLGALLTAPPAGPPLSLAQGATMAAGFFIIGAVITPDMSRFMRSTKDVVVMTIVGFMVGEFLLGIIAILMAESLKTGDVVTIMMKVSGVVGAAVVMFATIKINDFNLYATSLSVVNFFQSMFKLRVNRAWVTFWVGVIGTALSLSGILAKFTGFLTLLGLAYPPVGAIVIVDYFVLKRYRQELDESGRLGKLPRLVELFNPIAFIAWIIGFVSAYYIQWGIPSLTSLILTAAAYWVGMKLYAMANGGNMKFTQIEDLPDGIAAGQATGTGVA